MNRSFEEQVRERAYHMWESAGMAHGMAHEHWIHAERALMTEHAPTASKLTASKPSKSSKSTAKSAAGAAAAKTKVAKTSGAKSSVAKVAAITKKAPAATARASDLLN